MKRSGQVVLHCLIGVALIASLIGFAEYHSENDHPAVGPVRLSHQSGFYDGQFYLEMTCDSGEIRYTLDSTEPNENSLLYTEPILIEDASGNPNVYSMIEDVCLELKPDLLEAAERNPTFGFTTPTEPVDKATVVRAVCIDALGNRSDIVNAVYFVGFNQKEAYDGMNIIAITTNPDNLFDYEKGIYVMGKVYGDALDANGGVPPAIPNFGNWPGNYKNKGKDWEKEAYIWFFDADRNMTLSGNYGIRIQGGASRFMLPKSLNIFARKKYGSKTIPTQALFGQDWQLESLNLNSGGQGVETKIHDYMINALVEDCNVLTREYEPYELFLDGEFWGVYWLTPRFKSDYFENKYGIREEDLIVAKVDYIEVGQNDDLTAYRDMLRLIADNDMSVQENYDRVCEVVDMDSLIDYYAIEIYIANRDWPKNNRALWRTRSVSDAPYADGKWRFVLFDVNFAMRSKKDDDKFFDRIARSDAVFSSLTEYKPFRKAIYKRMAELARNNFNPDRVNSFVDAYVQRMRKAMANEYARFMNERTEADFVQACEDIKTFFSTRYDYIMEAYGDK